MDNGLRPWRWAILAGLAALAASALLTPSPSSSDTSLDGFSADRALLHIEAIAGRPHPMGSAEIADVRRYLETELEALGLEAENQTTAALDYYGSPGRTVDVVNVMARIPGAAPTGAILLMAHHDTVPETPGANDNSAAVAAILETARWLQTQRPLLNDLIVLFTDGEEPAPRYGATAFVENHPWMNDVRLVVNLEAIGGSGPSVLIETGGRSDWLIRRFANHSTHPAAHSFATGLNRALDARATDFTPFADAGVAGLNFAYLHGSPIYHTDADSVEAVSLRSLQHHGEQLLAAVRAFGDADLAEANGGTGTTTFFTIGGTFVLRYGAYAAVGLLVLAALMAGLTVWNAPGGAFGDAGRLLLLALTAAVAGAVLWRLITAFRTAPSIAESYAYLAIMVIGVVVAFRRWGGLRCPAGALVLWVTLGALLMVAAPTTAYVFVLPALAAGLVALWQVRRPFSPKGRLFALALAAAPALLVMVPTIDLLYQFAQPRPGNPGSEMLEVSGLVLFLVVLVVALVAPFAADNAQNAEERWSARRSEPERAGDLVRS